MKRMETQHWHHDKFGEKWKGSYYIHDVFDKGTYKLRSMEDKVLKIHIMEIISSSIMINQYLNPL